MLGIKGGEGDFLQKSFEVVKVCLFYNVPFTSSEELSIPYRTCLSFRNAEPKDRSEKKQKAPH